MATYGPFSLIESIYDWHYTAVTWINFIYCLYKMISLMKNKKQQKNGEEIPKNLSACLKCSCSLKSSNESNHHQMLLLLLLFSFGKCFMPDNSQDMNFYLQTFQDNYIYLRLFFLFSFCVLLFIKFITSFACQFTVSMNHFPFSFGEMTENVLWNEAKKKNKKAWKNEFYAQIGLCVVNQAMML